MLNFRAKIFRIIPIWLIIVLAISGTAAAALTWISNPLQTTVTVTKTPVTLSGNIITTRYAGLEYEEQISYTVNNAPAQGYILLTFSRAAMQPGATSLSDVTLEANGMAWSNNLNAGDYIYCLTGYPKLVGSEIQYLIGMPATVPGQPASPPGVTPFNFAAGGATSGILHWYVTYNTDVSMVVRVQVTSTLP
jgi:hypothetical protein